MQILAQKTEVHQTDVLVDCPSPPRVPPLSVVHTVCLQKGVLEHVY